MVRSSGEVFLSLVLLIAMDPAVQRPGRFGKRLYVPLRSAEQQGWILKALTRKRPVDASVDLRQLAGLETCEKLSGADLAALMDEAAIAAIEEKSETIKKSHFNSAKSHHRCQTWYGSFCYISFA